MTGKLTMAEWAVAVFGKPVTDIRTIRDDGSRAVLVQIPPQQTRTITEGQMWGTH